MRIGKEDKKTIDAFFRREEHSGHKLSSTGRRLDGHWMGGRGIAEWDDGEVVYHDLGSRVAQQVQRYMRKLEPERWIGKALRKHKKGALHRQLHVPEGEKIPVGKLRAAAKKRGKLGKRARLALTLRKLPKRKRRK